MQFEQASKASQLMDQTCSADRALDHGLHDVLVIEDEYLIAADVAQAFADIGCGNVEMAADIETALSILNRRCPGGAVLDLNLRSEMAFSVADALIQQRIPFVFMTGHDRSSLPHRFDAVMRCQKPIAPITVARALLSTVLNEPSSARVCRDR